MDYLTIGIAYYILIGFQTFVFAMVWFYRPTAAGYYWWGHPFIIITCILMGAFWPLFWLMELIEHVSKRK